jgi:hypothetical protein
MPAPPRAHLLGEHPLRHGSTTGVTVHVAGTRRVYAVDTRCVYSGILYVGMKAIRQFGVLVLLLVSCLAPAMACMVPNAAMSTQERACCRMMKNQCGQVEMPALHGCCQKSPPSVHDNALDTKAMTFHPVAIPVIWLAASELANPASAAAGRVEHSGYSPPKSPPSTISILRI